MAISFDKALGIHESALRVRTQRAEVLANNLANVETPGFQARDIDFKAVLKNQRQATQQGGLHSLPMQTGGQLGVTHQNHIPIQGFSGSRTMSTHQQPEIMYRQPEQASLDGNTVEAHKEHARFMENAMDFQASFTLLNKKFTGLSKALKGD